MGEYSKVLLARHNPEEKCFVPTGELLVPGPWPSKIRHAKRHFFVSSRGIPTRSELGWVTTVPAFSLDEFAQRLQCPWLAGQPDAIGDFLDQVGRIDEDTPVACTFFEHMFPERKMVLRLHKIFFYGRY